MEIAGRVGNRKVLRLVDPADQISSPGIFKKSFNFDFSYQFAVHVFLINWQVINLLCGWGLLNVQYSFAVPMSFIPN